MNNGFLSQNAHKLSGNPGGINQLTPNVKLLQKAVLWHQGEILILRRAGGKAGGARAFKWDLPGGNSEWPTQTEANISNPHLIDISREIQEESGIDIISVIGPQKWSEMRQRQSSTDNSEQDPLKNCLVSSFFEKKKQVYSIILGWSFILPDDFDRSKVQLSFEHTEIAWIKPENFEDYDFGFAGNTDGFIRQMVFR